MVKNLKKTLTKKIGDDILETYTERLDLFCIELAKERMVLGAIYLPPAFAALVNCEDGWRSKLTAIHDLVLI